MAKMAAGGDAYEVQSQTFEVVPTEKMLLYQDKGGMPNSGAFRCLRGIAQLFGQPADTSLTNWTEASDVAVANWLKTYYGKEGIWWKTKSTPGIARYNDPGPMPGSFFVLLLRATST